MGCHAYCPGILTDAMTRLSLSTDTPAERVFLVVVDDSPEMRVALRYAARRARHTGGRVALLHVIAPPEGQHWMALEDLMREEQRADAEQLMERHAAEIGALIGYPPMVHLREGQPREELLALIDEDPAISILVLAANTGEGGPGPLVTALTGRLIGRLRIPMTIVPGSLTDAEIDALA
jgi:nucleotide-binding universal stress UspA family protein